MKKLLFFYAPWCSPCHFYNREIIIPLEELVGPENIIRINVQEAPYEVQRYCVDKLPTIVILDGNDKVLQSTGGYTVGYLMELLSNE